MMESAIILSVSECPGERSGNKCHTCVLIETENEAYLNFNY